MCGVCAGIVQYKAELNMNSASKRKKRQASMMNIDMIINQVIMFYLVTLAIVIHCLFISDIF